MALADIVLEGLTLILVIALGAVLIGGLSYLTTTTASTNNARLITAGTYVYLAGPTYINGTLYVPMYNIGEYTVDVKYLFVEGLNGVQEYATNIILKPGQYYVYELSIDYTPKAVTIVVSPTRDPKLVLEFNSNVSTPGPIALTPISQGSSGGGLIAVSVVDPYNAGWTVSWSYSGQSYSLSKSASYTWFINPPYVPIQITFSASLTQNPTGYACQVVPSSVTNTYNAGSVQQFTVDCNLEPITVSVSDSPSAGWLITWSGAASGSENGSSSTTFTVQPSSNNTVSFTASITSIPSGALSCSINPTNTTANPGQAVTFAVSCRFPQYFVYVKVTGDNYGAGWDVCASAANNLCVPGWSDETFTMPLSPLYAYIFHNPSGYTCTISPSGYNNVVNGSTYTFTVSCSGGSPPPPSGGNNYYVYVTVINDSQGAGWQVSSSVSSVNGTGDVNNTQLQIGGPTDTLTATITSNPSGYACSISPSSEQVTSGNSYTFTVSCVYSPYPPCTVSPPSVRSSPSGAPTPTSSANVSSIPYNQSEPVAFTYNAPESGNNYVFQYWSIGGQTYQNNVVSITETLTCTTPGGTLTGPSGIAYYQYQQPGGVNIDPDSIDLTKTSETYNFTWTSDWSGTGTFTYSFTGSVTITYPSTLSGSVAWNANVTLPGGTIAAKGGGDLNITSYPTPPNQDYVDICKVSGSGTVNGVSASGGSEQGTAYITCTLQSRNGGP